MQIYIQIFQNVLKKISDNVFNNDYHDHVNKYITTNHDMITMIMFHQRILGDQIIKYCYQIIKYILFKYFTLRMHHECNNLKNTIHRIRNKHTKLILFKNQ